MENKEVHFYTLSGLPNTKENLNALFICHPNEISILLRNGIAAIASGDYGSFNIWVDDNHNVRCEYMAYCKILDSKTFDGFDSVAKAMVWARKKFKLIN